MGIVEAYAEKFLVESKDFDDVTGLGGAVNRLDLVAEDPLMPGNDSMFFVLSEYNLFLHAASK